jgi:hypothetical protein
LPPRDHASFKVGCEGLPGSIKIFDNKQHQSISHGAIIPSSPAIQYGSTAWA